MDELLVFFLTLVVDAAAVWLTARILPGVSVRGFGTALLVAFFLAILNATLRWILIILTLPVTILTLGLFLLVIGGLILKIIDWIVPGFTIRGFLMAIVMAVVLAIVNTILVWIVPGIG